MAFFEMKYHSDALRQGVTVNVILPEKAKSMIGMSGKAAAQYKTLYLLHGLSDDESIWMRRTSIERYAAEYGIAVVMPGVGRSWYTDTAYGAKYFTFVSEELPRVCRSYFKGMSEAREDNLIAGLSMGGYGAMKVALRCPETFGGCASLSGALDIASRDKYGDLPEWQGIFGYELQRFEELAGSEHDLLTLVGNNGAQGVPFPKLFLWCGTEDSLLGANRKMHGLLNECDVAHRYIESEGNHSWQWWDKHICTALEYLLKEEEEK